MKRKKHTIMVADRTTGMVHIHTRELERIIEQARVHAMCMVLLTVVGMMDDAKMRKKIVALLRIISWGCSLGPCRQGARRTK